MIHKNGRGYYTCLRVGTELAERRAPGFLSPGQVGTQRSNWELQKLETGDTSAGGAQELCKGHLHSPSSGTWWEEGPLA